VNLLETIRARGGETPPFLVVGSSEEYGLVYEQELPIKETNPLRPLSPYACSAGEIVSGVLVTFE
jgi:GDP-4-dehydro-6-deoxy-D-mannose reductase